MINEAFRISKRQEPVTLWVHPEGRVIGSVFLHLRSQHHQGGEGPLDVLNHTNPFLVLKCHDPTEFRFYNKRSIVRVEYEDKTELETTIDRTKLPCSLHMMDGSLLKGVIYEWLPPEQSRLFDYINITNHAFIKIHVGKKGVCLVNKAYIVRVTPDE